MVDGKRHFEVIDDECVGCNLCVNVCPVEDCITMEPLAAGAIDERTGRSVDAELRQLDAASEQPDGQGGGGVASAQVAGGLAAQQIVKSRSRHKGIASFP